MICLAYCEDFRSSGIAAIIRVFFIENPSRRCKKNKLFSKPGPPLGHFLQRYYSGEMMILPGRLGSIFQQTGTVNKGGFYEIKKYLGNPRRKQMELFERLTEMGAKKRRKRSATGKNWKILGKEMKEQISSNIIKKINISLFPFFSLSLCFSLLFPFPAYIEMLMAIFHSHEPLAYCHHCRTWQPMRWRPKSERGRKVETWFVCAACGCEQLTIRYLNSAEAKAQQEQLATRSGRV